MKDDIFEKISYLTSPFRSKPGYKHLDLRLCSIKTYFLMFKAKS